MMSIRRLTTSLTRLSVLGLVLAATTLGSGLLPEAGATDEVHSRWKEFAPSGRYILVRDNKTQKQARILHSKRAAAFLILDSGYDSALLVDPRESTVSKVPTDHVKRHEDGSADLLASATVTSIGSILRHRRDLQIRATGFSADLKPNPPLLAWKLCNDLKDHSPEYVKDANGFTLDTGSVERLKALKGRARVNVYFGSWCPTCKRYLGRIIRLEQALEDTEIEFHYYGLPKPPAMWRDAEVKRHRIKKIPTGVVYKDQRRVGMVSSTTWNRPAIALARLLCGG